MYIPLTALVGPIVDYTNKHTQTTIKTIKRRETGNRAKLDKLIKRITASKFNNLSGAMRDQ